MSADSAAGSGASRSVLVWVASLGVALIILVAAGSARSSKSPWPTAVLPNGNRLRLTSCAYAVSTNLAAPPHKTFGLWRSGPPFGIPAATDSEVPELLALFESEGRSGRKFFGPAGGTERLALVDAQGEVVSVGRLLSGFGTSDPLWKTENWVYTFGPLSNAGPLLRIAIQNGGPITWRNFAILTVTNPVAAGAGPGTAER